MLRISNIFLKIAIVLVIVNLAHTCQCEPPKEGDEICGSDGKTYRSSCQMFCIGLYGNEKQPCLTKVSGGACKAPECACKDKCNFVCGSNGQTYGNDCTLKCAQKLNPSLRKVKEGKCVE